MRALCTRGDRRRIRFIKCGSSTAAAAAVFGHVGGENVNDRAVEILYWQLSEVTKIPVEYLYDSCELSYRASAGRITELANTFNELSESSHSVLLKHSNYCYHRISKRLVISNKCLLQINNSCAL